MEQTISREQWSLLAQHLKDHVQSHFTPEELEVIERFILIAGHASSFDPVARSLELHRDRRASPAYAAPQPAKAPKKSIA